MLSDVTMGQFFPGKSVMHRLDPRIKMCLTVYFIVLIFCSKNFVTLGATILMSLLRGAFQSTAETLFKKHEAYFVHRGVHRRIEFVLRHR